MFLQEAYNILNETSLLGKLMNRSSVGIRNLAQKDLAIDAIKLRKLASGSAKLVKTSPTWLKHDNELATKYYRKGLKRVYKDAGKADDMKPGVFKSLLNRVDREAGNIGK